MVLLARIYSISGLTYAQDGIDIELYEIFMGIRATAKEKTADEKKWLEEICTRVRKVRVDGNYIKRRDRKSVV